MAGLAGPLQRRAGTWKPFREGVNWGVKPASRVALDKAGRFCGYFAYDEGSPAATLLEACLLDDSGIPDVLQAMSEIVRARGGTDIVMELPENDIVPAYCRALGLRKDVRYHKDGDGMIRLIDPERALRKLAADLGPRAPGQRATSVHCTGCGNSLDGYAVGSGSLELRTNLGPVGLLWSGSRLGVGEAPKKSPWVELPQWALAQLIYGQVRAEALAAAGIVRAKPAVVGMLADLFPMRPNYFSAIDAF
jgi:hypothetical protein